MKSITKKALFTGMALALAGSIHAAPITTWDLTVSALFVNPVLTGNGEQLNDQQLRWGTGASGQSGLDIENIPPAVKQATTNGDTTSVVDITHLNRPIDSGSGGLNSVIIRSTLTLTPVVTGVTAVGPVAIDFDVLFFETPNGANPCADGGANGVGVNINGCGDIFIISQNALNFPFFVDDPDGEMMQRPYFISFFELTSGLNPLSQEACTARAPMTGWTSPCLGFVTPEGQDTRVTFAALITTQPVSIPEPGSLALMGLGLGALGLIRRRKLAAA